MQYTFSHNFGTEKFFTISFSGDPSFSNTVKTPSRLLSFTCSFVLHSRVPVRVLLCASARDILKDTPVMKFEVPYCHHTKHTTLGHVLHSAVNLGLYWTTEQLDSICHYWNQRPILILVMVGTSRMTASAVVGEY